MRACLRIVSFMDSFQTLQLYAVYISNMAFFHFSIQLLGRQTDLVGKQILYYQNVPCALYYNSVTRLQWKHASQSCSSFCWVSNVLIVNIHECRLNFKINPNIGHYCINYRLYVRFIDVTDFQKVVVKTVQIVVWVLIGFPHIGSWKWSMFRKAGREL